MSEPYAPPGTRDATPAAIAWFRGYAALMAVGYATLAVLGGALREATPLGPGVTAAAAALALFFAVAVFAPRKPWGWTLGVVAIAVGVAGCAVVVAAPLLVAWTRPTVKAAFRRL